MTLKEWLDMQPLSPHVRRDETGRVAWVSIPDAIFQLVDRRAAWDLSDARVTSCEGGSIFFVPHA